MLNVVDDVLWIFQAYAETHQIRGDSGCPELLVSQLAMSVRGRMKNAGVAVSDMGLDGNELEGVHEAVVEFTAALEPYTHDPAES